VAQYTETVYDTTGAVVASAPTGHNPVADFDGDQLAWAQQPCVGLTMTIWDLQGQPTSLGQRCATPSVAGRLHYAGRNTVRYDLSCPEDPAGCYGVVQMNVGPREAGYTSFRLSPTQSRVYPLRLDREALAYIRAHPHTKVGLLIESYAGGDTLRVAWRYVLKPRWPKRFLAHG
jgi:hypothetical protein